MTTFSDDFIGKKLSLALKNLESLEELEVTELTMEDIDTYSKVYYLYQNIIERCLGLATYLIKDQKLPIPNTAKESFVSLAKMNIISYDIAKKLAGAYGMRNAIIHDYDDFQIKKLVATHKENLNNLRQFLQEVAKELG